MADTGLWHIAPCPTRGTEDAIGIPEINANFEMKHDTFYNALNANDQDSLNSAAGGNFLDKMPRECLNFTRELIQDVAALTTEVSEHKNMMKTMLIEKQKAQAPAPVKAVEHSCVTCGGITTRSGVAYKGPTIPTTSSPKVVERETEVTKDTMPPANNGSTEDVHLRLSCCPIMNQSLSPLYGCLDVYAKFASDLKTLIGNNEKVELKW
ncbi:hypothetical protein Tco_0447827 [Tanacetum coccineum]